MVNKKVVAGLEMVMMLVSLFAFGYFLSFDFELVSAQEAGCCSLTEGGEKCATSEASVCTGDFAEGSLCAQTSFCQKGCCYDSGAGIFDRNVLRSDCGVEWDADPNCNLPAADLGCCVLGESTSYETEGQCRTDTLGLALGEGVVDWRGDVDEIDCLILGATQERGACVSGGGACKVSSEVECVGANGDFAAGLLCTASELNSSCVKTDQTTCVGDKDQVYFVDSCGNVANVYDSSKADDASYWESIVDPEDLCGYGDDGGNGGSKSCGNCDRFAGGICASALDDSFDVDSGSFYCKDTSCTYKGEEYANGESWCVYDGVIGEGDDVVGSRHWKYVCSQGITQVEPCADYRNQICVQNDPDDEFSNAACVANNWRECLNLNNEDDPAEECAGALNCRIENISIGDQFKFDVCLPRYPAGFSLTSERYMTSAKSLCGMASQRCTVVREAKTWGGCEVVSNGDCLTEKFAQEMNEFCTGIGDCGGSANILGEYSSSYSVSGASEFSTSWVNNLKKLAIAVEGQYAPVEDYSEYLEAAGWGNLEPVNPGEEEEAFDYTTLGSGIGGLLLAAKYSAGAGWLGSGVLHGATLAEGGWTGIELFEGGATASEVTGASISAYAGVAIGAVAGMVAGAMLAEQLGLSEGGTMLMAIGGALLGGLAGAYLAGITIIPVVGWAIAIVAIVLIALSFLFGGDDCPPIEVDFTCKPWKPLAGGDSCETCNEDPLKPCSEYRCKSLGAGCGLVNAGTENEMCIASADDGRAPVINPDISVFPNGTSYDDHGLDGFGLRPTDGECFDAYEPLVFGVTTSELAYCKFDIEPKEFEEMGYDLGPNAYVYNHTTVFSLPDPGHGQSQGANWSGDLSLFVQCEDTHGSLSTGAYEIDMCVREGPDEIAPRIVGVSPSNDGLISFDAETAPIEVVTNELSTCRWSLNDVGYFEMENIMTCDDTLGAPSSVLGYSCTDDLDVADVSNAFYVKCKDQPWLGDEGNFNFESFVYVLRKPESKIGIDWVLPDEGFETNTAFTGIELVVKTIGGGDSHFCSYSFSGYENMIEMFETGENREHRQALNRPAGEHEIYVQCRDETGDFVQGKTEFEIISDYSSPEVARVWQNAGRLFIWTTDASECRYSEETCRFAWEDGIDIGSGEEHTISVVRGETYYVKCEDEFGNRPSGCSVAVRAL
ncbi:hypothetical protein HNV12_03435 [Methanococcoides sp. SA1]|nr:hypothetical protein [Methanococcoides sp. SA1]